MTVYAAAGVGLRSTERTGLGARKVRAELKEMRMGACANVQPRAKE